MTRKRLKKLLMGDGASRNEAERISHLHLTVGAANKTIVPNNFIYLLYRLSRIAATLAKNAKEEMK